MFDPISLTITAASLAATTFGTMQQVRGARQHATAQRALTGLELQVEEQRRKAMELDARRRQVEQIRQGQRARAMSLTTATAQGAAQGSVLGGAYGQATGQMNWNLAGIQENLAIGRNIFGINQQIGQQRMSMASAQSTSATGAGITSLGGALLSAGPQIASGIRTGGSLWEDRQSTFGFNPIAGASSGTA